MSGFLENLAMRALAGGRSDSPAPSWEAAIAAGPPEATVEEGATTPVPPPVLRLPSAAPTRSPARQPPGPSPAPVPAPRPGVMREVAAPTSRPAGGPPVSLAPPPAAPPMLSSAVSPTHPEPGALPPALVVSKALVAPVIPEAPTREVPVEESPVTDQRRDPQVAVESPRPREPRTEPRMEVPTPPPVIERHRIVAIDAHEGGRVGPRPERAPAPTAPLSVEPGRARVAESPTPRADAIRSETDSLIPTPEPLQPAPPDPAVRPVRVTIGAIEVRVSAPATPPMPETPSAARPAIEGFEGLERLRNYNY